MKLLLQEQRQRLLDNGRFNAFRRARGEFEIDFMPVVKLLVPHKPYIWLLGEIDPDDHDAVLALCDTGIGLPILRYVSLTELNFVKDIRQDEAFAPTKSLRSYAVEADTLGRISA